MNLRVYLPTRIFLDVEVTKIKAEAENGSFTLLPRHLDWVAALVPGILSYESGETEEFLAVDGGILVKSGPRVTVSTRNAIPGKNLGSLRQAIEETFRMLDERERQARSVLARFEADFIRRFVEMERNG
ncbi:MAG: F0F1 ATP synthase subunit epsilon [Candidatus Aminicenantes bacterium]|nr:F0F1 ATP synthase subunit epsilon [Candidatus Aminicenantes bacterium]